MSPSIFGTLADKFDRIGSVAGPVTAGILAGFSIHTLSYFAGALMLAGASLIPLYRRQGTEIGATSTREHVP